MTDTDPGTGTGSPDPIEVVQAFLSALEALDLDEALTYAAPRMIYQNVPLPPARGLPAVEKQLRTMMKYATGFEARTHNIAAKDGVVLTERTDVLRAGGWSAEFWVCGTFEVRDGKIVLWRDYFDWATFVGASLRGLGRSLGRSVSRSLSTAAAARRRQ